jgi:peptide/nickel transport system substrate-binding protein
MPDAAPDSLPRAGAPPCSLGMTRLLEVFLVLLLVSLPGCSGRPDRSTLVMIIESSPANLDPRVGIDGQSERIDELLFDALLTRDEHLEVRPGLAERWETPDPVTYVFHMRPGVKFHDGRPLTSRDVKWTFDSLLSGKIRSTKASTYRLVDRIDAPDDDTVIFHLKEPFAALLWNLSEGAIGIVPYGSGGEMSRIPVGTGPFRFVSAEADKEVVLARNGEYWGEKAQLQNVRLIVVPDTTTQALELRKGSADIAINAMTPDMVFTLERESKLDVLRAPGTILQYMGFNLRDPIRGTCGSGGHWHTPSTGGQFWSICGAGSHNRPPVFCRRRAGPTRPTCRSTTTIPSARGKCSMTRATMPCAVCDFT